MCVCIYGLSNLSILANLCNDTISERNNKHYDQQEFLNFNLAFAIVIIRVIVFTFSVNVNKFVNGSRCER